MLIIRSSIRGDLIIDQRLGHIYGDVDGSIQGKGAVHIAEGVVCKSKMKVAQLIVSGTVEGNVRAGRSVTVGANGKIIGNVKAARISVEEGGQIVGRVKIKGARD